MKVLLYSLAIATLVAGVLGLYGEYQYLTDDSSNQSRYQAMHFAAIPPIVFSPGLVLFGVCYWRLRARLSSVDAVVLNVFTLPLLLSLVVLVGVSAFG